MNDLKKQSYETIVSRQHITCPFYREHLQQHVPQYVWPRVNQTAIYGFSRSWGSEVSDNMQRISHKYINKTHLSEII